MSETLQRRYIMLLCLKCNGDIPNMNDEEVACALRITKEQTEETKKTFIDRNLIDEKWSALAWEKRQYASDDSTFRVKKMREKNKENVTGKKRFSNDIVTPPDTDTDTDTEVVVVDILRKTVKQLEQNICMISNQIELDTVKDWTTMVSEEWINEAIKIAALKKARSIKYVDSILVSWAAKFKPEERPWEATRDGSHRPSSGGSRTNSKGDVPEGYWD
jgi:DnaD/phage-associated family protein